MNEVPRLDELGRLVGDPSRAVMLGALMDGRAWTGRELAGCAHVAASTASSHLQRLVTGGLLTVVTQGRSRYYRIASPRVAAALESLMLLAPARMPRHASERRISADLAAARLCYDHLAGRLGVAIAGVVLGNSAETEISKRGIAVFEKLGIALNDEGSRRPLCRPCLDWSERRPHVAGIAGSMLARAALDRDWVRRKGESRALVITSQGAAALKELFGIDGSVMEG
jgi:DNA-binding transcriptional ArsR family regulator